MLTALTAIPLTILGAGTDLPIIVVALLLAPALSLRRSPRYLAIALIAACLAIILYRSGLTPRNDRNWLTPLSVLPRCTLEADTLTIQDVRAFAWRPDLSFDPAWEMRSYPLSALRGVDLILEPFEHNPLMAHTMLSFDFAEHGRLLLSIEARQEVGERYGAIPGGLNQFELIYIFMDEQDGLGIRAHKRHELYSFPAVADPIRLRAFLLALCATANNLRDTPRFYRIVRDNCTTAWIQQADALAATPIGLQLDAILSGRVARLLHARGGIDTDLPYDQAKARFRIDHHIIENLGRDDFSARIRVAE